MIDELVMSNGITRVVKDDVEMLRDVFDFHELDALLLDCERKR